MLSGLCVSAAVLPPPFPILTAESFEIPLAELADTNAPGNAPLTAVCSAMGTPDSKITWDGRLFKRDGTNLVSKAVFGLDQSAQENVSMKYCRRVIKLNWQQQTNQVWEVFYTTNIASGVWQSLYHKRFVNQTNFTELDAVDTSRCYRLQLVTP
jgi:hypothetical protein